MGAKAATATKKRAPQLRTRIKQVTAEALVSAAEAEIAETGIVGVTIHAIAKRAGVSVGTLYNHFADREALLNALFEARRAAFLERLDASLSEISSLPFRTQLHCLVDAMFRKMDEHRPF